MSPVSRADRTISSKIVYYGPAGSGKTTNLRYLHQNTPPEHCGPAVRLANRGVRAHGFDFLPLDLGIHAGVSTGLHLYSVPGGDHFRVTRRLVLEGAHGVVVVADSQRRMLEENIRSLQNLRADLEARNVDMRTFPLVLQYNKRDLPAELLLSVDELDTSLNYRSIPTVVAEAVHGVGVFEALQAATGLVFDRVERERRAPAWI